MANALVPEDCRIYGVIYYNLITNVGGKICRSVLYNEVGKTKEATLFNLLQKKKDEKKEYCNLKKHEVNRLYPGGTPASDADQFDITLLMAIFRNFIFKNPEKEKLNRSLGNIPDADQTVADDLSRIRCYRNKLHEIADTQLSMRKEKFDEYVEDLKNVFTRLAKTYNLTNIEKSVDEELGAEFLSLETQIKKILEEIKQDKIWAYTIMKAIQNKQNPYKDVKDVLPDAVFVETEQYKETKKYLLDKHIIFLDGSPGEGKTTIAKKLLTEVSVVKCIEVSSVNEFFNIGNDADAVLIDDMFGASVFDKYKYRKWQNKFQRIFDWVNGNENQERYVVITSRTYILEKAKDQSYFPKAISSYKFYTLSSDNLQPQEKKLILENHFKITDNKLPDKSELEEICNMKQVDSGVPFIIGFPECARLFSGIMSKEGKSFFKTPMKHIKNHMFEICKVDETLVAFFLLWTRKALKSRDLERPLDETLDEILIPIKSLQFSPELYLRKMRDVLYNHVHSGGLIKEDANECLTFSHYVVRDAVGLIAFERNPTATLALCDKDFIERYISLEPKKDTEIGIRLKKSRYDQLSSRILALVIQDSVIIPDNYSLFKCRIFENEEFCSEFFKDDKGKLQILLTRSVRTVDVIFQPFKFNFLVNVVKEVKLASFLLWHKGKVTTFAKRCLEEIHDNNEKLKELSTVLYIASAVGLYEVAEFAIKQGGKINSEMILIAFKSRENVQMPKDEEEKEEAERKEKVLSLFKSTSIDCFPDSDGRYPIHLAAMEGYLEFVQKNILEQPDDAKIPFTGEVYQPKSKRKFKMNNASLYHIAAFMGNNKLIEELHKARVPALSVDSGGRTPFLYAIEIGKSKVVKTLLDIAIKMENEMIPDTNGNTPLHLAIIKSDEQKKERSKYIFKDVALHLCKSRSENIPLENNNGKTPLHLACTYHQNEVIIELLKNKETVREQNLYHKLIKEDNESAIEVLLINNYIQDVDSDNRTPIELAEGRNKLKIVGLFRKYSPTTLNQHSSLETPKLTSEAQHLNSTSPQPQSDRPRSYSETPQSKSEIPQAESETPHPTSETQQPKSETQHHTSETQQPESETPHPTSETQTPKSETPHTTSETQTPKSETPHTTSETQTPKSETFQTTLETQTPKSESKTPHPTPKTQQPESETPHPTSETQTPKSETQQTTSETQTHKSETPHTTSETQTPKSMTPQPTSETQTSKSETPHITSETQTPESETTHTTSETQKPKSETPQPTSETQTPKSETPPTTSETQTPESETMQPTKGTQTPKSETPQTTSESQTPKSETPQPTSETQTPKSETPHTTSESQTLKSETPQPTLEPQTPKSETPHTTSETQEPESDTPQPKSEPQQPESETSHPASETQIPKSETPHTTSETQEPESDTPQPISETQTPKSETPHTTSETQPPESKTQQFTPETQKPVSETPHPTFKTQQPVSQKPYPTSETQQPESETPQPTSETQQLELKTPHSTSETKEPDSETPHPTSETQQPKSLTPPRTSETQQPESDTRHPTSKTKQPESETLHSTSETPQPETETPHRTSKTQPPESDTQQFAPDTL